MKTFVDFHLVGRIVVTPDVGSSSDFPQSLVRHRAGYLLNFKVIGHMSRSNVKNKIRYTFCFLSTLFTPTLWYSC